MHPDSAGSSYNIKNMDNKTRIETVLHYHTRTKHQPDRFARGPHHMDWANEPEPFRFFEGAALFRLPFLAQDPAAGFLSLFDRAEPSPLPLSLDHIASMLELSMGLSAWKSFGRNTWALRMNPSSGNLHPTEAYVILPPTDIFPDHGGIFHYNPYVHGLEKRSSFDREFWQKIRDHVGTDGFFIGLSSIHWREAWKYGERAFRYCNHDLGHALACLSFAAGLHGWRVTWLSCLADDDVGILLGFDRTAWHASEQEYPDLLLLVHSCREEPKTLDLSPEIVGAFSSLSFEGLPNRLSKGHANWKIIEEAAAAAEKPRTDAMKCLFGNNEYAVKDAAMSGAAVIRRRRSAQAYDGVTAAKRDAFFSLLDKTVPRQGHAPFDAGLGKVSVHLALFVHRVDDLQQGLYFLCRDHSDILHIQHCCHRSFLWERVKAAPESLALFLLEAGDYREKATAASCFQEIAGDSAFSLGMIAKFRENIEKEPWSYRRLFWESGMIGQVLYLGAEALGLRGTGIGCYLDDMVHHLLGITDDSYQSLYHFTVGGAVEDRRITTLPPYHHLSAGNQK